LALVYLTTFPSSRSTACAGHLAIWPYVPFISLVIMLISERKNAVAAGRVPLKAALPEILRGDGTISTDGPIKFTPGEKCRFVLMPPGTKRTESGLPGCRDVGMSGCRPSSGYYLPMATEKGCNDHRR